MIAAEGWEFAEQVQLTEWTKKIHKHRKALPRAAMTLNESEERFEGTLFATHKLRHSAVHRHRICASRVGELVEYALALVIMLKDSARARGIERIGKRVKMSLEDLEDKKRVLEERLAGEMDSIAKKRAELDLLEKDVVERIVKDDKNNQLAAGLALEEVLDQDEMDVNHADPHGNQAQENHESEGEVPERTTESSAAKNNASIQDGPESNSSTMVALEKSTVCRSRTPGAPSVSAMKNKLSGRIETSMEPSRTRSTKLCKLNQGPLFNLQLSDSIHNPINQSPPLHDNIDLLGFSLDDIDKFEKNAGTFNLFSPSLAHIQLSNPFHSDTSVSQSAASIESDANVATSASIAFHFSKPNLHHNTSGAPRTRLRLGKKPVKISHGSSSKSSDIAVITDDEIT